MIFTSNSGPVKRSRNEVSDEAVFKNLKKIRISTMDSENGEENDDDYDESIVHNSTIPPRKDDIDVDPLYFSPRRRGIRHVDEIVDDLIRKSRRRSWEQQSVASIVPPSDFALSIPTNIGPHPGTDMHYLSRSQCSRGVELLPSSHHQHHTHTASPTTDTMTHQEWFALGYGGDENITRDDEYSSDDCEDMIVTDR
jgi:hypothetical protein